MTNGVMWFIVVDNEGETPFLYRTERKAQQMAEQWDEEFPSLSPHRIIRLQEVTE